MRYRSPVLATSRDLMAYVIFVTKDSSVHRQGRLMDMYACRWAVEGSPGGV